MNAEQVKSGSKKDEKSSNQASNSDDIEFILNDLGGTYGKFQLWNYLLFSIPVFVSGTLVILFVFTTLNVDYR